MGSKKMKKMKMGISGMGGAFGMPGKQTLLDFVDPSFTSKLSRHIAAKMVKRGVSKGVEIARLKKDIELTNAIGPPEEIEQPLNKEELTQVAQRLHDLGYYYEKDPESDEIEFTLAPTYMGIVGKASSKEQDSLQATIKRFQRIHGFLPNNCNGCIQPGDKTLKNLNSNLRTSLISHGMGPIFRFEEDKGHDHLHPILWDFMDDIEWIYKSGLSVSENIKRGRRKTKEESIIASNYAREIIISYASRGYSGDGHKSLNSKHYEARAIDIISVNGKSVSEAPRELELPSVMASKIPPQFQQTMLESAKIMIAFLMEPVISFAHLLEGLKEIGDQLPIKWRITELDSPWHGDKENHQDYIHVAIGRKIHVAGD